MKKDELYPIAYVLHAAREDGDAQDMLTHLRAEAVNFIFDLVERARAFNEKLPHGYWVKRVRPHAARGAKAKPERLELRCAPRTLLGVSPEHKVAERDITETRLYQVDHFTKHLNAGLLDEMGAYFVQRSREAQEQQQTLERSLRHISTLRHLLLEEADSPDDDPPR